MAFVLFVLLLGLPLTVAFYNFYWKRRHLPPGPPPLPLLGNALELGDAVDVYKVFNKWTAKYGPVFTFWLAEDPVVAITDYSLIKEMFIKDGDSYNGRYLWNHIFPYFTGIDDTHGVARTEGDEWRQLRRFSLQVMKNLGMGKSRMETELLHDIGQFSKDIEESLAKGNHEFNIIPMINQLTGSTINQLIFGYGFGKENMAQFHHLKQHLCLIEELLTLPSGQLIAALPWLRHLPVFSSAFQELDKAFVDLFGYFDVQIKKKMEEQKRTFAYGKGKPDKDRNNNQDYDCFLDAFLNEMEAAKGRWDEKIFSMQPLRQTCFDLFLAGQDSTSSTLAFLVLYVLGHPDVQRKLQEELDSVLGKEFDGEISMAHKSLLPYTNAVINETQRLCDLIPLNLNHRVTKDVVINGIKILSGTIVTPEVCCVLADEKIFPRSKEFIPERFIDSKGQLMRCDELIPFSVGGRKCLGETLARMELFLFTANFFHKFRISLADPKHPPAIFKKIPGVVVRPAEYTCRLERR
ncbi:cytochrome p450 domain-containing protein [Ditylenchus destructor]|nr:cytochrome p450 domain-containing protein [Ditylenchus destructor]